MTTQAQPNQQVYAGTQQSAYADQSVIQFKLDTEPLLREFELFLSGKRSALKYDKSEKRYIETEVTYGKELANKEGVNSILKLIMSSVNPHNVQGNFDDTRYQDYICWRRKEIAEAVVVNRAKWKIEEEHMDMIIDNAMALIEPFMTRLIDNEERKSHGQWGVKEVHTIQEAQTPGLLSRIRGG